MPLIKQDIGRIGRRWYDDAAQEHYFSTPEDVAVALNLADARVEEIRLKNARDLLATIEDIEKDDADPEDNDADRLRNSLALIAEIKEMLRSEITETMFKITESAAS